MLADLATREGVDELYAAAKGRPASCSPTGRPRSSKPHGTLTVGRPVVTRVLPAVGVAEAELLAVAATVEAGSSHPLAQAILRKAQEAGVEPLSKAATDTSWQRMWSGCG